MTDKLYGWEAVQTYDGVSLSITGMLIVFATLTLISLFTASMPYILVVLEKFFPQKEHKVLGAKKSKKAKKKVLASMATPSKAPKTKNINSQTIEDKKDKHEDEAVALAIACAFDARRG